jgi:hypothetical protein
MLGVVNFEFSVSECINAICTCANQASDHSRLMISPGDPPPEMPGAG